MADKEVLERMLSMLPEEFQDIYDDTIPEAKEMCKKMGDNADAFLAFFIRLFGTIILAMLVIWIKNKIQSVNCLHGTISKS